MRILIDTQCFLWMAAEPDRLSQRARALVEDTQNTLYLSAASAWEIAIKHALGKLRLPEPPPEYVPSRMSEQGVQPLAIEHAHALRVSALPKHHGDPFDRLLVAQAQLEHLEILTSDPAVRAYDIRTIPA